MENKWVTYKKLNKIYKLGTEIREEETIKPRSKDKGGSLAINLQAKPERKGIIACKKNKALNNK